MKKRLSGTRKFLFIGFLLLMTISLTGCAFNILGVISAITGVISSIAGGIGQLFSSPSSSGSSMSSPADMGETRTVQETFPKTSISSTLNPPSGGSFVADPETGNLGDASVNTSVRGSDGRFKWRSDNQNTTSAGGLPPISQASRDRMLAGGENSGPLTKERVQQLQQKYKMPTLPTAAGQTARGNTGRTAVGTDYQSGVSNSGNSNSGIDVGD